MIAQKAGPKNENLSYFMTMRRCGEFRERRLLAEKRMNESRRQFLQSAAATAAYGAVPAASAQSPMPASADVPPVPGSGQQPLTLNVNGRPYALKVEPRVTLLDALREYVGLSGTKKGCDRGQCGACTVLANGRRINSCLTLALSHDGEDITTVEGLARGSTLHPMQAAFLELDAFQCGYCTPGQICSAVALLSEVAAGMPSAATENVRDSKSISLSESEIRERMSGNICRCGAYSNIVAAVKKAGGAA
jgi:xanthine dehydrogenase YagT iron-sulfur-binding subunit